LLQRSDFLKEGNNHWSPERVLGLDSTAALLHSKLRLKTVRTIELTSGLRPVGLTQEDQINRTVANPASRREGTSQIPAGTMATTDATVSWKIIHVTYNGRPCEDISYPVGTKTRQIRLQLADIHSLTSHYVEDETGACVYASQRLKKSREYYFHCSCGREFFISYSVCFCSWFFCNADIYGARRVPPLKTSWFPWVQTTALIKPVRSKKKKGCITSDGESAKNSDQLRTDAKPCRPHAIGQESVLMKPSEEPVNSDDIRPRAILEYSAPTASSQHSQLKANAADGQLHTIAHSTLAVNSERSLLAVSTKDGQTRAISEDRVVRENTAGDCNGALQAHADPVSECCSLMYSAALCEQLSLDEPIEQCGLRRRRHPPDSS
jgi:hypothetical protein